MRLPFFGLYFLAMLLMLVGIIAVAALYIFLLAVSIPLAIIGIPVRPALRWLRRRLRAERAMVRRWLTRR